jgi:hypothetical protein
MEWTLRCNFSQWELLSSPGGSQQPVGPRLVSRFQRRLGVATIVRRSIAAVGVDFVQERLRVQRGIRVLIA